MMPLDNSDDHVNEAANEWGVAAVYNVEVLNALWSGTYSKATDGIEVVAFRQTLSEGRQWEDGVAHLAGVSPSYNAADATVTLNKRIVEDRRVITWQEAGARGKVVKQLERVTSSAQKILSLKVGLNASYWRYSTGDGGKLRLHWSSPPVFALAGDEYLRQELEKYYSGIKNMVASILPSPASSALNTVWILHEKNSDMVNFLVSDRYMNASDRCLPLLEAPVGEFGAADADHLLAFSAHMFPEVKSHQPPADRNWVPRLFAPENSHSFGQGYYLPDAEAYWAFYPAGVAARTMSQTAAIVDPPVLNPLAQLVSAGDSSIGLALTGGAAGASWTLAGDALGKLDAHQGQYAYTPPQVLNPRAQLSAASKTLQPAAYKASAFSPVSTDIVRVTAGQVGAEAIFLTQYLVPTHFFSVAKQGNTVSFSLRYVNKQGEEKVVPPARIKWHIVAGNGTVSAAGVFTPHPVSPTACTVVMAEEDDDDEWYWAATMIPSPLFDADAIVRFFAG